MRDEFGLVDALDDMMRCPHLIPFSVSSALLTRALAAAYLEPDLRWRVGIRVRHVEQREHSLSAEQLRG